MITLNDFEKFTLNEKITWLKAFLDQFNNPKILDLKKSFIENENGITSEIAISIFTIILNQYFDFVNNSANSLQEFIGNIHKLEEKEKIENNPDRLLTII